MDFTRIGFQIIPETEPKVIIVEPKQNTSKIIVRLGPEKIP